MDSVIKRELDKVRVDLPPFDDTSTKIIINKSTPDLFTEFELNAQYEVELADYIIYEPKNFSLSSNWNNGIVPKSKHMFIYITKIVGKMINCFARGYNSDTDEMLEEQYESLWLPMGGLKVIRKL